MANTLDGPRPGRQDSKRGTEVNSSVGDMRPQTRRPARQQARNADTGKYVERQKWQDSLSG